MPKWLMLTMVVAGGLALGSHLVHSRDEDSDKESGSSSDVDGATSGDGSSSGDDTDNSEIDADSTRLQEIINEIAELKSQLIDVTVIDPTDEEALTNALVHNTAIMERLSALADEVANLS